LGKSFLAGNSNQDVFEGKSFGGAVATYLSLLTARDSTPAYEIFSGLCLESTFTTIADAVK
jgi:hypothetical protein